MNNRIVIDTSVFVSALIGADGPSRKLIRYCLLGQYQPLIGNALFAEYEAVMGRKEIIDQCVLSQTEVVSLLEALMSVCEWVNIYYLWRPNLRDEGDNHLIELAISGNAHYIATNNVKDFQGTELIFPRLSILKPEHLLRG
ncbi:putative toxin-antitoxin system toxin component, PIN family [Synechocystis sp. PCC 6714]|uniref:putative toxin-antitoxin system toxin component, PIN family n=1 Tax=Synechocystis sp. (strain PCC 6714) TaxID=1147 RepID=UPI00048FBB9A|nr:putative toxin-antitoxin system toxin component, PIN family [Synechocystis sp. PCC 6714]